MLNTIGTSLPVAGSIECSVICLARLIEPKALTQGGRPSYLRAKAQAVTCCVCGFLRTAARSFRFSRKALFGLAEAMCRSMTFELTIEGFNL